MGDGIGCNEFARIIGASHSEVSRAAAAGLIRIIATTGRRRGPGSSTLDRQQAYRIAAAVECGIPWRVAAALDDRLEASGNGIRVRLPLERQLPRTAKKVTAGARRLHRPHKSKPLSRNE